MDLVARQIAGSGGSEVSWVRPRCFRRLPVPGRCSEGDLAVVLGALLGHLGKRPRPRGSEHPVSVLLPGRAGHAVLPSPAAHRSPSGINMLAAGALRRKMQPICGAAHHRPCWITCAGPPDGETFISSRVFPGRKRPDSIRIATKRIARGGSRSSSRPGPGRDSTTPAKSMISRRNFTDRSGKSPARPAGPLCISAAYSPDALEFVRPACDVLPDCGPNRRTSWSDAMKAVHHCPLNRLWQENPGITRLRVHGHFVRDTQAEARATSRHLVSKLDDEYGTLIRDRALRFRVSLGVSHQAKCRPTWPIQVRPMSSRICGPASAACPVGARRGAGSGPPTSC